MAFKKGKSGNPGGRPKEKAFRDAMRLVLNEEDSASKKKKLRVIAEKVVEEAMKGEPWACTMVADRMDGKPAQAIVGDSEADPVKAIQEIRRVIVYPKSEEPDIELRNRTNGVKPESRTQ